MTDKTDHRPAAALLASLTLLALLAAPAAQAAGGKSDAKPAPARQATSKQATATTSETRRIGAYQHWDAYEYMNNGTKLCYLHSQPQKKEPAAAKRGEIYILVTHKPKEHIRNEVSIYFGYPLKESLPAEAVIDGNAIDMFTHEEAAWAADSATDQKLVQALQKGRSLVVKGVSTRGTKTTDTYDLSGFTNALHAIDKACNMGGGSS
ncbi:invasion associated locus B family protein [Ferrovibrio xuzhouensis]|uniref:Invasion associated locus B family protein n=1 Tax=Ferrovibrio xuzhouensis TaxID=1576914 RepID=A0ABV7VFJ6_9PROT